MSRTAFALFGTAVGRCAIVWGESGVLALRLPASEEDELRRSVARIAPLAAETPLSGEIARHVARIDALTRGERDDLRSIPVDLTRVPDFHRRVYDLARAIGPGETRTYGEIAKALGEAGAARAVGAALGANPVPIIVPCHRVIAAKGGTGGFTAPLGLETKLKLLSAERARFDRTPTLFDNDASFILAAPRARPGRK